MTEASPPAAAAAAALSRPEGAGPSAGASAPPGVYYDTATTSYTPPHHWNAAAAPPSPTDHGVRAATLLGVGGALGWTAAAAYQWLNGGDFTWLPSSSSSSSETGRHHDETSHDARTTRRFPSHAALIDAAADAREDNAGDHPAAGTDSLTAPIQSLVEALQTQSREQRDILQTLVYHKDRQQTDASMRRLRQSSSTATLAEDSQAAASLSQLLVFGKLAEVQAELSSLRRDVATLPAATTVDTIAWEARLGETLTQVEECVARWQETAAAATTTISTEEAAAAVVTADTGKPTRVATPVSAVDATPVRTKIPWSSADDTAARSSSHATPDSPLPRDNTVEEALTVLVLQNDAIPLRVGTQLLYLYAVNLSMHSSIPRYRKIFTSNESFQKVDALTGGRALLRAVGFVDEDNSLVWQPATGDGADETEALVVLGEVAVALGVLKSSSSSSKEEESAREDLLAQALACLSVQSAQASLVPPTPTTTTTPDSHMTNSLLLARPGSSGLADHWRTPDPSIVSPPVTKKQGGSLPPPPENEDDAVVQFSPPRLLQGGSRSVVVQENVEDSHGTPPTELDTDDVLDVDSVWK
jgi:hypothetical protein